MPLILPVKGKSPKWGNACFIADNSTIVGDVVMVIIVLYGLMQLLEVM
jgi:hypothetical protein